MTRIEQVQLGPRQVSQVRSGSVRGKDLVVLAPYDQRRRLMIAEELLKATDQGLKMVERWHLSSADSILALIAFHIATLITQEAPDLLKSCAGPDCTLWFIDRTKAHRRVFCSPATCGNRVKVAAFRQRQRQ